MGSDFTQKKEAFDGKAGDIEAKKAAIAALDGADATAL